MTMLKVTWTGSEKISTLFSPETAPRGDKAVKKIVLLDFIVLLYDQNESFQKYYIKQH